MDQPLLKWPFGLAARLMRQPFALTKLATVVLLLAVAVFVAVPRAQVALAQFMSEKSDDRIAAYTFWLMLFTAVLALGTIALWWTTRRTLKHLEREFLAAHPPRIALRRVTFEPETAQHPKHEPMFKVEIANVGDAVGVLRKTAIALQTFATGRAEPWKMLGLLEVNELVKLRGAVIANGASFAILLPSNEAVIDALGANRVAQGTYELFCFGYIEYSDVNGQNPRRTGFIRRAILDKRWFEAANFPEFEYQD